MTVSEVLEKRVGLPDAPFGLGPGLSIAAHVAFFALLAIVSRPRPVTVLPIALPVRVISPGALGARPAPALARPPAPVPEKPARPKHVIEKLEEKPVPSPRAMPDLSRKKKPAPTPAPAAAPPAVDLPSAGTNGGSSGGSSGGSLSVGTSVAALDVEFPYQFYVDQMLTLIGGNWLKPEAPEETTATVSFDIQRDGRITDVKLLSSSGVGVYDRAAVRAVYGANPLPPLPPEFPGTRLGVHLRFR